MCFRRSARLTAIAAVKERLKDETAKVELAPHVTEKRIKSKKLPKNFPSCSTSHRDSLHGNGTTTAMKIKRASSANNSQVIGTSDQLDTKSPTKQALIPDFSSIKTVTEKDLQEAIVHLIKVEPKLESIIEQNPCHLFSSESLAQEIDPFKELSCSIISQQVSCAAAKSIQRRFVALFTPPNQETYSYVFPTPYQVHAAPIEILRTAGLSQRKAEYLKGLAKKFHTGELDTRMLLSASYDDVFDALIQVRGLGKWSIEMFACFGLKRIDIFSTGDLGVQRGMALLSGKNIDQLKKKSGKWKYMYEKEMEEIANKFKPYRSVFMWYTWRVEKSLPTLPHTVEVVKG